MEAFFVKKINKNINFKLTAGFQTSNVEQGVVNAEVEYEGEDSLSSFKFGQGHWGYGITQRVHPNLLLGFDYYNLVY